MDSVIIIAGAGCDIEEFRRKFPPNFEVREIADGRVGVRRGERQAYLSLDDQIADEIEPERLREIESSIPAPCFFALDFNDLALGRELLIAIADRTDILIETADGGRVAGTEFVRALKQRPDWDFRKAGPGYSALEAR